MIIKGKSRSNAKQLATYLLRADPRYGAEKVTVLEVHSAAPNLIEAFRDWEAVGEGTRGDKPLYHAQISPAPQYADAMTADQWKRSADILARELGLEQQPRAIVVHDGNGRPHAHVVWQRTDVDTMKLVDDGWNYRAHERASAALENEFGHEPVPGKHAKRDREKQPEIPKESYNQTDRMIAERTGITKEERIAHTTALQQASDSGQAFKAALEDAGYVLAQGDRGYVMVDGTGTPFALSRYVDGMKAKDVKAFMADVPLDGLPTVEEAKALQAERKQVDVSSVSIDKTAPAADIEPLQVDNLPAQVAPEEPLKSKFVPQLDAIPAAPADAAQTQPPQPDPQEVALRRALAERQDKERNALIERQAAEAARTAENIDREIREKLAALDAMQQAARDRMAREQSEQTAGLKGILARLSPAKTARAQEQRRQDMQDLIDKQTDVRIDRLKELQQAKGIDMDDLTARHEQQQREQQERFKQEEERYIRDRMEALRIQAEIDAARLKEQSKFLGQGEGSGEDPPPPKLVK